MISKHRLEEICFHEFTHMTLGEFMKIAEKIIYEIEHQHIPALLKEKPDAIS